MLGIMIITNDPLAVAERFSERKPQLMHCSQHVACVFVPCAQRTLTLPDMQNAVKGCIELFHSVPSINKPYWASVDFFCNEEGKLQNLPPLNTLVSHHRVAGDVLVCGTDSEGDSVALSEYDLFQSIVHTSTPSSSLNLETARAWLDTGNSLTVRLLKEIAQYAITQTNRLHEVYSRL